MKLPIKISFFLKGCLGLFLLLQANCYPPGTYTAKVEKHISLQDGCFQILLTSEAGVISSDNHTEVSLEQGDHITSLGAGGIFQLTDHVVAIFSNPISKDQLKGFTAGAATIVFSVTDSVTKAPTYTMNIPAQLIDGPANCSAVFPKS